MRMHSSIARLPINVDEKNFVSFSTMATQLFEDIVKGGISYRNMIYINMYVLRWLKLGFDFVYTNVLSEANIYFSLQESGL